MGMTEKLEKMLAGGRDDAMLRFGLGSAYFNEGRFSEAVEHLEACVAHDPTYSAAYKLLGRSYLSMDASEKAVQVFESGLPVSVEQGDKQSEKEMQVFLARALKETEKGKDKEKKDG